MSKVLRYVTTGPVVSVGEKHLDLNREELATKMLGDIFPIVSVMTDPDGARFIPISEVYKLQELFERAKADSHRDGFDQGQKTGLEQGLQKADEVANNFDRAIADIIEQRERIFEESRQNILQLVMKISRKVTSDAVSIDPEVTIGMINGVIDTLVDRSRLKIKVNPNHLPIVEQNLQQFLKGSSTIKELTFEADPRVTSGGCFIETPTGDIDARLESQLDVIEETLLNSEHN